MDEVIQELSDRIKEYEDVLRFYKNMTVYDLDGDVSEPARTVLQKYNEHEKWRDD